MKAFYGRIKYIAWCCFHPWKLPVNDGDLYLGLCPAEGSGWHERPSKTQIRLRNRAVWSESSMAAEWSNVSSVWKLRLWSECADVQADWNMRYTHMPISTLYWIPAQYLAVIDTVGLIRILASTDEYWNRPGLQTGHTYTNADVQHDNSLMSYKVRRNPRKRMPYQL